MNEVTNCCPEINETESESDCNDNGDASEDNDHKLSDFQKREILKNCLISNQISQKATNELMHILSNFYGVKNLPKDARTFLHTPSAEKKNIRKMGSGEYWHNGLMHSLKVALSDISSEYSTVILTFNVDGLPIFKSSNSEFWPILARIDNITSIKPIVIGIYSGVGKPPCNEFLLEFVDELNDCIENGVTVNDFNIKVKIKCFICDSPARSFLKGSVSFNAYSGCMKCTVVGEYDVNGHHMSFPRVDLPLRTDSSFRNRDDPDHHKWDSVLEKLPIDMVNDFIVADSLHLIDLGIMKKCLVGWTRGSFNFRTKWSARDIQSISELLENSNSSMPSEIHRAVRKLDSLKFWKALEFRTFLLYLGPVILKDFLPEDAYTHFLLLFSAIRICSSERFFSAHYLNIAKSLLHDYIEQYIEIYGIDSIGSNVHNLCHLVDDVERFGILPSISAYPFENMLYFIKNLLRPGKLQLSQVANRIIEITSCKESDYWNRKDRSKSFPYVHKLIKGKSNMYEKLYLKKGFVLTNNERDKWFLSKSQEILHMHYATVLENNIYVCSSKITQSDSFFEMPFNSTHINIYLSDGNLDNIEKVYCLKDIDCKLIALNYHNKKVFIPLLHTFENDQ